MAVPPDCTCCAQKVLAEKQSLSSALQQSLQTVVDFSKCVVVCCWSQQSTTFYPSICLVSCSFGRVCVCVCVRTCQHTGWPVLREVKSSIVCVPFVFPRPVGRMFKKREHLVAFHPGCIGADAFFPPLPTLPCLLVNLLSHYRAMRAALIRSCSCRLSHNRGANSAQ